MEGKTLGPYEIKEPLGAGGMGEVYRALDTKLGREVAIKVLPADVAGDEQRLARFRREAQVLASLNHPNIGSIYGIEESGGTAALVLELVEGPTLEERMGRERLPIDQALDIALQIATALEAAHESGIVHRDLKPANVKVDERPEGRRVKVLDFGLAKGFEDTADSNSQANSPTLSLAATQAGMILGTAAYMSPEQARGVAVDKRADIWSFGIVLFEMLSGQRPFGGETVSDTLADVLRADLDWDALPANTPAAAVNLLQRCLVRDPMKRLRDIGDARIEIEAAIEDGDDTPAARAPARSASPTRLAPWAIALIAITVAVWALMGRGERPGGGAPFSRYTIALPEGRTLVEGRRAIAISPDGSKIAYVANERGTTTLFLRQRDQGEAQPIPGTDGARTVFFSPDGEWIGFRQNSELRRLSLEGGAVRTIVPQSDAMGADWTDNNEVIYSPDWGVGLSRVSAEGGEPVVVTHLDLEANDGAHLAPDALPGGDAVVFAVWESMGTGRTNVAVATLASGEHRVLIVDGSSPRYHAPTEHLLFVRGDTLMAVPFDAEGLEVSGDPVALLSGVRHSPSDLSSIYDIADDGTLIFQAGGITEARRELVWMSPSGEPTAAVADQRPFISPEISPDGSRIGVTLERALFQVWIYDLAGGTRARLTLESDNGSTSWTPDGREVVFWSARAAPYGLYRQPADGSGDATLIYHSDGDLGESAVSPDSTVVIAEESVGTGNTDLMIFDLDGDPNRRPFVATEADETQPAFSRNGRWVAFQSNESGNPEIYIRAYPGPGTNLLISSGGGTFPRWSPDGAQLFYRDGDRMFAVDIDTEGEIRVKSPELLFEEPGLTESFDVARDRDGFLMIRRADSDSPDVRRIEVALNWPGLLRRNE